MNRRLHCSWQREENKMNENENLLHQEGANSEVASSEVKHEKRKIKQFAQRKNLIKKIDDTKMNEEQKMIEPSSGEIQVVKKYDCN